MSSWSERPASASTFAESSRRQHRIAGLSVQLVEHRRPDQEVADAPGDDGEELLAHVVDDEAIVTRESAAAFSASPSSASARPAR